MEITSIRDFAHKHCRFKLRSGKEVFGVIWEVETQDAQAGPSGDKRLFFASIRDYERLQTVPHGPVSVIDMRPEEIMHAERLAS